jgi:hypothetical protein
MKFVRSICCHSFFTELLETETMPFGGQKRCLWAKISCFGGLTFETNILDKRREFSRLKLELISPPATGEIRPNSTGNAS